MLRRSSTVLTLRSPGSAPPAAAPPPTHPPSISELSLSSPAKLGRIRIYPDNAAAGAYVAKTLNTSGHFLSTSVLAQSLEVQVIPCKGPQNVVLMVGTSIMHTSTHQVDPRCSTASISPEFLREASEHLSIARNKVGIR